jgi:XRE family aerobic/anaerobic benzoate catabolism transcriptional regulator
MTRQSPGLTVETNALLTRMGEHVRNSRVDKRLPRRTLSELSGVSARYLAQLEAGEGNISSARLQQVAQALALPLERLVGSDAMQDETTYRIAMLFHKADPDTQDQVIRLLAGAAPQDQRARRLCLVGLRGAGKSTLGAMIGQAVGLPFIELNREIERQGGMPVAEIMALYGAEGYRTLEADALQRVADKHQGVVLAVAGGIVSNPGTYATVQSWYHTLWLKASPQEHMERVRAQGDTRPMAGNPEAMAQLRALLEARAPLYAQSDMHVNTSGATPDQSLAIVLDLIASRGFALPKA